ncbi:tyrosine-type recombinase/integrase [Aquabacterium humicola]|uniref:tyrosine-type recombinase/integrase n=1 Tax=Aquabacterium humicola TaxID=3237377 RepID=UPI002543FAEE|nr:site-specific integrase [Rubrivivax pictus]
MRKTINLAAAVRAMADRQAADLTLQELVKAYAVASLADSDLRLRKWTDAFGHESAWRITSEHLETAAQAMLEIYKPSSVNRDLSALGSVYRWARDRRLSPRGFRSPTLDVRRYDEGIRRVEITDAELQALRDRALGFRDRRFGVFVSLLMDTGARKGELLDRSWAQVDLERCEITCPTTKTGVPRILHFRPATADLIRRVYRTHKPEALLFEGRVPGQRIDYKKAWATLVADIGRPDLHMHDVRHAVAAALLRSGTTLAVAAQVMGHDPAVLARRYGHLETGALRRAQEQAWAATN